MVKKVNQKPIKQAEEANAILPSKALAAEVPRKPHKDYKFIDITKRVDVIYENFVHDR